MILYAMKRVKQLTHRVMPLQLQPVLIPSIRPMGEYF